jgi:hypothetical protein
LSDASNEWLITPPILEVKYDAIAKPVTDIETIFNRLILSGSNGLSYAANRQLW